MTGVARKRVDEVLDDVSDLIKSHVMSIKYGIHNRAKQYSKNLFTLEEFNDILEQYSTPFAKLNTEAKRFKYFKDKGTFILLESHKLGEIKVIVEKNGEKVSVNKDICV